MARGQPKKEPTLELPDLRLPRRRRRTRSEREDGPHEPPAPVADAAPPAIEQEPQRGPARPLLRGRVAAGLTGVVVGLAGVGGTYAGITGCEAVRGVSTCGGGTGLVLLVAILTMMLLLGAGLLRMLGVGEPTSTSFLGVGLVTVVSMLVLLEVIYSPWMVLVVPALTGASYLLAHAVTTGVAGDHGRRDWT